MVFGRGAQWRWKNTGHLVTANEMADWFERVYPEPWAVRAKRAREAADEVDQIFREILPDAVKRRIGRTTSSQ